MILQITSNYFTAGIIVNTNLFESIVTEAAPIVKYMENWPLTKVYKYCEHKNWKIILYDTNS